MAGQVEYSACLQTALPPTTSRMKRSFTLALLAAAAFTEAFQPFATKSTATILSAESKDCRQGDMRAECLLSGQELKWFLGKSKFKPDNGDLHEGDAWLVHELEDAEARVRQLEAVLATEKFYAANVNQQEEDDDCEVQDPRNDCHLSKWECQWTTKGTREGLLCKILVQFRRRRKVTAKERMDQTKQRINTIASSIGASALATFGAKIGSRLDIQLASVSIGAATSGTLAAKIQSILSRILPTFVTIGTAIGASIGAAVGIKVAVVVLSRIAKVR